MLSILVDNAWCAGVVLGLPRTDWQSLVLANDLASRGTTFEADMIVMTGSTLGTKFPAESDRFVYEIKGLGAVEATIV